MTKIALICDTHFGVRSDSPVFHEYFKKCLSWFFSVINEQNIKQVIHLGDLFDRRKYLSFLTANVCREHFLTPLEQNKINTHIIAGNHDQYFKNTFLINSLDEIVKDRYKYIHTYNQSKTIEIDGLDILLLPWINQSNEEHSFDMIKKTKADIIMGHLELLGFEMFRGSIATHGDDKKLFEKFDLVFSGHYHHKSSISNIHYLGAFAEYTWSDYNDPRGFHVFDTQTREFEFYRNPHQIFKMFLYDDVKHPEISEKDFTEYKDCYVKVVCANKTNPYIFDMMIDKLYKENPIDISVIEDVSSFTDNAESDIINEAEDTQTILKTYVDNLTLPVDKNKMKNFMLEVYKEAISIENV